jgi:hypothetical protein
MEKADHDDDEGIVLESSKSCHGAGHSVLEYRNEWDLHQSHGRSLAPGQCGRPIIFFHYQDSRRKKRGKIRFIRYGFERHAV